MLERIGKGILAQLISLAVSLLDRVVLVGLMVRVWGGPAYADWSLVFAAANLLVLGELGLNIYFGNAWRKAFGERDDAQFQRVLSIAITVYAGLALMLGAAAVAWLATADLVPALKLHTLSNGDARLVAAILTVTIIAKICRGCLTQLYRGRDNFARSILMDALCSLSGTTGAGTAVLFGASLAATAVCYLVAELVAGWVCEVLDLRRRYPAIRLVPAVPTLREWRALGAQLRWYALVQGTPTAWTFVPVLLAGSLGQSNAVITFVLLRTLVNFARTLVTMVTLSAGAELIGLVHDGNRERLHTSLLAVSRLSVAVSSVLLAGLYAFLVPVISVWTRKPELADHFVLALLVLPAIIVAPSQILTSVASYGANPRAVALAGLVQIIAGLLTGWIATRTFGVAGLAAGLAFGECLAQAVVLPRLAGPSLAGRSWITNLASCLVIAIVCGGWALLAGIVLSAKVADGGLAALSLALVVWGAVGALPALAIGIGAGGRQQVSRLIVRAAMGGLRRHA